MSTFNPFNKFCWGPFGYYTLYMWVIIFRKLPRAKLNWVFNSPQQMTVPTGANTLELQRTLIKHKVLISTSAPTGSPKSIFTRTPLVSQIKPQLSPLITSSSAENPSTLGSVHPVLTILQAPWEAFSLCSCLSIVQRWRPMPVLQNWSHIALCDGE